MILYVVATIAVLALAGGGSLVVAGGGLPAQLAFLAAVIPLCAFVGAAAARRRRP